MWDFSHGPVRIECEFCILEERVGVLDLFEECLFRPGGVFSHSVSIYLRFSDHSAGNLSVDNFVPDGGFGKGDGWMSWCQCVHNCLGCFRNICVFRFIAESDSEIVLFCPSSQDCFDVVVLGACHIDFVRDDVRWCLDSFPRSVSAEAESVDLPVLEGRLLGSRIDRGRGFRSLVWGLVFGQYIRIVCCERG